MANDSMKKELVAHKVYSAWQFITYSSIEKLSSTSESEKRKVEITHTNAIKSRLVRVFGL